MFLGYMVSSVSEDLSVKEQEIIPVLMLRDTVVFPQMVIPLFIGREQSVAAVRKAWNSTDKRILLVTQKHPATDNPTPNDLYSVGTVGEIKQILELSDGTVKILVVGKARAKASSFVVEVDNYVGATIKLIPDINQPPHEVEILHKAVLKEFENYAKFNTKVAPDLVAVASKIEDAGVFADTIVSCFSISIAEKQAFLENCETRKRLENILAILESENNVYSVEKKIRGRVKKQIEKTQREYYLNEQLRAIHKELGNTDDVEDDFKSLEERIKKTKFSKEGHERAMSRLKKLRTMNSLSSEASVVRSYLEWLLDIPWQKNSKIKRDLSEAEAILNRDHYGLKNVKDRILEYLAVQFRVQKIPGQVLCFVGPPGVGKTSLGKSIAEAVGRSFVRVSLGGVSDESEIRGHRSTYIGAMPGKIIQGMKKAKTSNPLFLLDEIDKLGHDWRGDPTSALLEVLDTEQNSTFSDNYIEIDYDLSNVMFVATANTLNMPQPLLDRMEIIRIPGYTEDEKIQIAMRHLIPKQKKIHGLKDEEFSISDDALVQLIEKYTREAGVRNLEREIATLARKSVKEMMTDKVDHIDITVEKLKQYCGIEKYTFGKSELFKNPGISTGLAWTEAGGDILFIEVLVFNGKGQIIHTGKLGDVMKESIQASLSYVKSKSVSWNLSDDFFEKHDIHIHIPEGATPKDGPSAGTAICTALTSALTHIMVKHDVAMTGEINLRGQVLEIGGLKEKLLAAHRGGIKTVIIPKENEKDLQEIDEKVKQDMNLILANTIDDVLRVALLDSNKIGL